MDTVEVKKRWREHLRARRESGPDLRVGITANFTVDSIAPFLGAALLDTGRLAPAIEIADYNQIIQTCLDPEGAFDHLPDVILVALRVEDLGYGADKALTAADAVRSALKALSDNFGGVIIIALPPRPSSLIAGLDQFAQPDPLIGTWHRITAALIENFAGSNRFYFVDLDETLKEIGPSACDERKRLLYRQPFSEAFYLAAARSVARVIRARRYEAKKCLVLDCDNTLWGGVAGEDGLTGIQLSEDFPGSVFREVQRQAKALRDSGIMLALATKNNPDDVWQIFDAHDGMILKRDDFAAARINWRPKSENLKEIAIELNVGLDALVFIDDNPFEISEVGAHAPEVTCLLAPEELSELPSLLKRHAHLWDRLSVTADDRRRTDRMRTETDRRSLAEKLTKEEFLAELGLNVHIYPPSAGDMARVTQLINKTNQFNLATRRYAQEEVAAFEAKGGRIFCMSVKDKYGEYGLVAVAMVDAAPDSWLVDNFLMSCRILGRGVETALLAHIASTAAANGAARLRGVYCPTSKNAMVQDFYARHGFVHSEDAGDASFWEQPELRTVVPPPHLKVIAGRPE